MRAAIGGSISNSLVVSCVHSLSCARARRSKNLSGWFRYDQERITQQPSVYVQIYIKDASTASMKNIWGVNAFAGHVVFDCMLPHRFAVTLHSFLKHHAYPIYDDLGMFFVGMHLADQAKRILKGGLLSLDRSDNMLIIVFDVRFGSGKECKLSFHRYMFRSLVIRSGYASRYGLGTEYHISIIFNSNRPLDHQFLTRHELKRGVNVI